MERKSTKKTDTSPTDPVAVITRTWCSVEPTVKIPASGMRITGGSTGFVAIFIGYC